MNLSGCMRVPLLIVLVLLALTEQSSAHSGGLDSLGCHHSHQDSGYHCHRGALSGQFFTDKAEAIKALRGSSKATAPNMISGQATVIDGDTIEIAGKRVRLHGIDAPESGQTCTRRSGETYRCGQVAAIALADRIDRSTVACEKKDVDRYKRVVAVCRAAGEDLNRWLVERGYAVAYRQYSSDYIAAENAAKSASHGLWDGIFVEPGLWRRGKRTP